MHQQLKTKLLTSEPLQRSSNFDSTFAALSLAALKILSYASFDTYSVNINMHLMMHYGDIINQSHSLT